MSTPTSAVTDPLASHDVASAMHPGVLSAPAGTSLHDVAAIMTVHQVHAVVLTDAPEPSVVTALDVVAAAVEGDEALLVGRSGHELPVVAPDDDLAAAVRAMAGAESSHAIVRAPGAELPAGMLSSFDVAAVIGGRSPRAVRVPRPGPARPMLSERRLDRLAVRDVMHAGLAGVAPAASLPELAAVLADRHIHAAVIAGTRPAAGGERMVWAIATDMDLLRAAALGQWTANAAEVAGTEPLAVDAGEPLDAAATRLVQHGVGHAVVTAAGRPAGTLSTLDVLHPLSVSA